MVTSKMETPASPVHLNTSRFFLSSAPCALKTPMQSGTMQPCFTMALPERIIPTHQQAISLLQMHPDKEVLKCGAKA
jgi:hypothetical protein